MYSNIDEYIELIRDQIHRVSREKFTGNIKVNISMRQGGIGRVNLNMDTNLELKNLSKSAENATFKKKPLRVHPGMIDY